MKEFEDIYVQYYGSVYRFLYRICGQNHNLAEELTQDTFCEAFRCYHKYNAACSINTWLCAIGKNLWFHYLRKHKNTVIDYDLLTKTVSDDLLTDPQENVEASERSAQIRKALSDLKPRYREIIWLRGISGFSFSKIGEIMNISENSAKVLFFRAKNQMKEKLENEGLI